MDNWAFMNVNSEALASYMAVKAKEHGLNSGDIVLFGPDGCTRLHLDNGTVSSNDGTQPYFGIEERLETSVNRLLEGDDVVGVGFLTNGVLQNLAPRLHGELHYLGVVPVKYDNRKRNLLVF